MGDQSSRARIGDQRPGRRGAGAVLLLLSGALAWGAPVRPAGASAPKYYFQLHQVESRVPLDGEVRQFAGEALKEELASRPEWESELGGATTREAVITELKRRHLAGFDVLVKIADLKKEVKDPNPGSRLKRVAVSVKLSVLGTTLPGDKIAFGGDGEATAEAEVIDRRIDAEGQAMVKDSIRDAVKQAVDQAVLKLGVPRSMPQNESRRKRKGKANGSGNGNGNGHG